MTLSSTTESRYESFHTPPSLFTFRFGPIKMRSRVLERLVTRTSRLRDPSPPRHRFSSVDEPFRQRGRWWWCGRDRGFNRRRRSHHRCQYESRERFGIETTFVRAANSIIHERRYVNCWSCRSFCRRSSCFLFLLSSSWCEYWIIVYLYVIVVIIRIDRA